MNRIIVLIFLSIIFMNCTSNTILEKPKDLIPKEQMVDLITDLFLANEAKSIKNENLERNINYSPLIYEKYKIDSLRFKESNLYYTSKIDEYNDILNEVDKRLKTLLEEFEASITEKDSIDSIDKSLRDFKNKRPNNTSEKVELEKIED